MSSFLAAQVAGPSASFLMATDLRSARDGFGREYSFTGLPSRPWEDGFLWPRSYLASGSGSSSPMLSEDSGSRGKWSTTVDDATEGGSQQKKITGNTLDSTGALLGSVVVQGFVTATDAYVGQTVSDANGWYSLPTPYVGQHYIVAYKPGSPDVAGTTVNTIVPV